MEGIKGRNRPSFDEDDLTFTLFPGTKKSADKHNQFYSLCSRACRAMGMDQCWGWEDQPCSEFGAVPGPRASRKLYQLQVPPMERAVLLRTKVSIPLIVFWLALLGIFS